MGENLFLQRRRWPGAVKDAILEGETDWMWPGSLGKMYVCVYVVGGGEHKKGVKASDFLPFLKFYMCELQSCLQSREELVSMPYNMVIKYQRPWS